MFLFLLALHLILCNTTENEKKLKIEIFRITGSTACLPEGAIFDTFRSFDAAAKYASSQTGGIVSVDEISHTEIPVRGCNIRMKTRGVGLIKALHRALNASKNSKSFSVVIGPPLSNDCKFVSDWLCQGEISSSPLRSLYQITYSCRLQTLVRNFANVQWVANASQNNEHRPYSNLAALTTTVQTSTLVDAIEKFLRYNGWKEVLIVYEISEYSMQNLGLASSIKLSLTTQRDHRHPFTIHGVHSLRWSTSALEILRKLITKVDAVVLLGRPPITAYFIKSLEDVEHVEAGQTAIIQVDPTTTFTYDALRFWRMVLQNQTYLGIAERNIVIMTALPFGNGFNMQSSIFQSKILVSLASAVGMAVKLTYLNVKDHVGTIPEDTEFFRPLIDQSLQVPVLPNITFNLYREKDRFIDWYDFYFFSITLKREDHGVAIGKVTFADIFQLNSVILAPSEHIIEISAKIWPNKSSGPLCDHCLLTGCNEVTTARVTAIATVELSGVIALGIFIIAFFKQHHDMLRHRKSRNKLILYPDDIKYIPTDIKTCQKPEPVTDVGSTTAVSSTSGAETSCGGNRPNLLPSIHNTYVHIKRLSLPSDSIKARHAEFLWLMREIRSRNVNLFVGGFREADEFSIVFEYCSRGSLTDILANPKVNLDWEFKLSLITDIVQGMNYLQNSCVKVHGRLTSNNCLIDGRWVLKITDYGVNNIYGLFGVHSTPAKEQLLWTAPELLRDLCLLTTGTQKGDVYSFGILVHCIVCRLEPYVGSGITIEDVLEKIRRGFPVFRPEADYSDVPPFYLELMKNAWAENAALRPRFHEIGERIRRFCNGIKANIVDHMLSKMEDYSTDLEGQIRDRTNELEQQKQQTELLIASMLPRSVAQALVAGITVAPETFDEVTIYFSDVVGFSIIAAKSTPLQIVDLLNNLYSTFDSAIKVFDVYKVETISDSYMVTSGLPIRNDHRHAGEIATMALELMSCSNSFVIHHMPNVPVLLRIGIHTGSCVAGVIGLSMPRYCLFGDTVNTASRMESSGEALRIHVSPMTKEILDMDPDFKLEYRGLVLLKGRGEVKTYWLLGRKGFTKPLPRPLTENPLDLVLKAVIKQWSVTSPRHPTTSASNIDLSRRFEGNKWQKSRNFFKHPKETVTLPQNASPRHRIRTEYKRNP